MTQENKELVLRDLCARLPYNCRVFYEYVDDLDGKTYGYSLTLNTWCINEFVTNKAVIKPYLRPLSSMTEEEKEELKEIGSEYLVKWENAQDSIDKWRLDAEVSYKRSEFYNYHLLDWRGLIPKGLALEAPEGMYN
jgi:hypothetical protein